jgi:hypothetical protein
LPLQQPLLQVVELQQLPPTQVPPAPQEVPQAPQLLGVSIGVSHPWSGPPSPQCA